LSGTQGQEDFSQRTPNPLYLNKKGYFGIEDIFTFRSLPLEREDFNAQVAGKKGGQT